MQITSHLIFATALVKLARRVSNQALSKVLKYPHLKCALAVALDDSAPTEVEVEMTLSAPAATAEGLKWAFPQRSNDCMQGKRPSPSHAHSTAINVVIKEGANTKHLRLPRLSHPSR